MIRKVVIAALCLASAAFGQAVGGGGVPGAGGGGGSLPAATAAGQVPTATGAGTTYTAQAAAPLSSIFYIASNCKGLANCLAWVDDDSTDNCGTATTNFFTALNSYTGPGFANLFIQGSGSGKAYKLVTCAMPLLGPSGAGGQAGSINVVATATIDCAQSSGPCIQMGATGCPTTTFYSTGCHDVTWRGGTIVGCVSTTACMEIEQGMYINVIDDVIFNNTGAGNATIGSCTNYSVLWHTWIGGQEFSRNRYWGNVAGQCFSSNNDTTGGANTIIFTNNVISHSPGATCGSIGHFDSSSHSTIDNNTIYGWSSNLTLAANAAPSGVFSQAGGWMISGNNLDYSQDCAGAGGVQAEIQFSGSAHNVGPATIINNNVQSSPFIARANGSTVQMTGWNVSSNNTYVSSLINLIGGGGSGTNCLPFGTSPSYACYLGANPGFSQNLLPAGTPYSGWITLQGNNGHLYSGTLAANQSSTAINGQVAVNGATYAVSCQTILTRAASSSSALPTCVISWTDLLTSTAETATITTTSAANTVGTQSSGMVYVTTSGNISVSTTGYASVGGTTMQYSTFSDITRVY